MPLTLLFRHLRDDATALIGGAAATAFMRLGNHHEAEQAASFIGRHHKFTVSGWTATQGGEHSTASTSGYSHGTSQSRGTASTSGWSGDGIWDHNVLRRAHPLPRLRDQPGMVAVRHRLRREQLEQRAEHPAGLRVRRRARRAAEPARQRPAAPGTRHRPAAGRRVRPPDHHSARRRRQPRPARRPRRHAPGSRSWPELAPPRHQPASQLWRDAPTDSAPAWPPQRPGPRWPRQGG